MKRIKGLFARGENEVEIPRDVETMVSVPREPRVRRPVLITPYDEVRTMVGMRPPCLQFYSGDPYCTFKGLTADGLDIPLLPGVPYPVTWSAAEHWPVLSDSEKSLEFSIPLGRTFAWGGITKWVETQAYARVPIVLMPWGWSRIGIVGRKQFNLDVVSPDFSSVAEFATKRYEVEHLLKSRGEAALVELLDFAKRFPDGQKTFAYDEMLKSLGLGGMDELLTSKDPEATLEKWIAALTRAKNEMGRSKR